MAREGGEGACGTKHGSLRLSLEQRQLVARPEGEGRKGGREGRKKKREEGEKGAGRDGGATSGKLLIGGEVCVDLKQE